MRLLIGSDHVGFDLKSELSRQILEKGYFLNDIGTFTKDRCNYNEIGQSLAKKMLSGDYEFGILICGTGVGMSIAANRIKGIRAVCCSEQFSAIMSRRHNDSNVLCLGSRIVAKEYAIKILDDWLITTFDGERHKSRIEALDKN